MLLDQSVVCGRGAIFAEGDQICLQSDMVNKMNLKDLYIKYFIEKIHKYKKYINIL